MGQSNIRETALSNRMQRLIYCQLHFPPLNLLLIILARVSENKSKLLQLVSQAFYKHFLLFLILQYCYSHDLYPDLITRHYKRTSISTLHIAIISMTLMFFKQVLIFTAQVGLSPILLFQQLVKTGLQVRTLYIWRGYLNYVKLFQKLWYESVHYGLKHASCQFHASLT